MKNRILSALLAGAILLVTACSDSSSQDSQTGSLTEASSAESGAVSSQPEEELSSVVFSHQSGVYSEEFSLTVSANDGAEILYTLDGSDPLSSDSAKVYTDPVVIGDRSKDKNVVSAVDPLLISANFNDVNSKRDGFICTVDAPDDSDVDKCTVIRAVAKKADGSFGEESCATYFIGTAEEHIKGLAESCEAAGTSLAVISLAVNYDDFFGSENGIYVKGDIFDKALEQYIIENKRVRDGETARSLDANYKQKGREWERTAALSMFEMSPGKTEEVLNQLCGVRIQGNYSRSDLQKGLRLYARSDYGKKNFNYSVFGDDYLDDNGEVMDKFKTLILRAGGNCAFLAKFNDTYWQTLCSQLNVKTKRSRPCVVYLNGEYWGLYVLEEDQNDDHLEELHGVNKDDVVIYKGDAEALKLGYKLDEGTLPEGITDESWYFSELLEFFDTHSDLKSEKDYAEFEKLVDVSSVMDYFAAEVWMNNKWDWPGKNWSMWRTVSSDGGGYADGRWRFIMYDVEFGGICGEGEANTNTIKDDNYKPLGLLDKGTDNPAVLCFAYLMTNDGFRTEFCQKLTDMSDTTFEKTAAMALLDSYVDIYSPLYDQFFERYPGTGSADDAINGGYGSAGCIRGFFNKRSSAINKMVKYCESKLGG